MLPHLLCYSYYFDFLHIYYYCGEKNRNTSIHLHLPAPLNKGPDLRRSNYGKLFKSNMRHGQY